MRLTDSTQNLIKSEYFGMLKIDSNQSNKVDLESNLYN